MGEEEEAKRNRRTHQQENDMNLTRSRTHTSTNSARQPGPTDQEKNPHKPFNTWSVIRLKAQRPLGEWLGTTIFAFLGIGANLAIVTSDGEAGSMETQYWAWGFATMVGKVIRVGLSCTGVQCFRKPLQPSIRSQHQDKGFLYEVLILTFSNRHLHIRRQLRRLPQSSSHPYTVDIPRVSLASRAALHLCPSTRRFLWRSAGLRSPLRQHRVPRRRPATGVNGSKCVHTAA